MRRGDRRCENQMDGRKKNTSAVHGGPQNRTSVRCASSRTIVRIVYLPDDILTRRILHTRWSPRYSLNGSFAYTPWRCDVTDHDMIFGQPRCEEKLCRETHLITWRIIKGAHLARSRLSFGQKSVIKGEEDMIIIGQSIFYFNYLEIGMGVSEEKIVGPAL